MTPAVRPTKIEQKNSPIPNQQLAGVGSWRVPHVGLFAARDIKAYEELAWDYGYQEGSVRASCAATAQHARTRAHPMHAHALTRGHVNTCTCVRVCTYIPTRTAVR